MNDTVTKRPAVETDLGAIYDSWPKGAWFAGVYPKDGDKDEWFTVFYKRINDILTRANVTIACLESDPDFILGYTITDGEKLEWIYVKGRYRRQGIAKFLLRGSHVASINEETITKIGQKLRSKLQIK